MRKRRFTNTRLLPLVRLTALVVCAGLSATAHAHHSHASLNKDDVRTYAGVVTRYSWTMPHVFIKIDAPDEQGNVVEYTVEMLHPPAMARNGWSRDSFRAGDRITWHGAHDRDPERHYTGLEWAERGDGTRLGMDPDAIDMVAEPSTDLTGLWKRPEISKGYKPHYTPPEGWPMSEKGQALVDGFHESQNPMIACGNPGPPKAMILPYPMSLTRPDENTVVIERELMLEKRIIHLNGTGAPGEPSKLGFSRGRFEGDELVVETTNFIADKWGTHTGIDSDRRPSCGHRAAASRHLQRRNSRGRVGPAVGARRRAGHLRARVVQARRS